LAVAENRPPIADQHGLDPGQVDEAMQRGAGSGAVAQLWLW
jgi:hypothetical protein